MGWTFYDSSGRKLNTTSTLIDNLDIANATDIGAAIVDADLFIIDDGANGTNRKTEASRIKTYANPGASGGSSLVLIGTTDCSSTSSVTITGLSTTYDAYLWIMSGLVPADDGVDFTIRMGNSSGIDSGSTDYSYIISNFNDSTASHENTSYNSSVNRIAAATSGIGNGAVEGFSLVGWVHVPVDSGHPPYMFGNFQFEYTNGQHRAGTVFGRRNHSITLDRVLCSFGTGNIASGRVSLWGLAHG